MNVILILVLCFDAGTTSAANYSSDNKVRAYLQNEQILAAVLERLFGEVKELKSSKTRTWQEFEALAHRVTALEGRKHDEVFQLIKQAMNAVEDTSVEVNYRRFEAQLKLLESELQRIDEKVDGLEGRVSDLEKRLKSSSGGKTLPSASPKDASSNGKTRDEQRSTTYYLSKGIVDIANRATQCCVPEANCVEVYIDSAGPYHGDLFVNCHGRFVLVQHPRGSRK